MPRVQSGLDSLVQQRFSPLQGRRVGVLCHQASVDKKLRHILTLMREAKVNVTAVFAPEHGLWGTAQDQVPIDDHGAHADPSLLLNERLRTRQMHRPSTYSLYGDNRAPKLEQLDNIDVLVCDLQDAGSRYYTFIWTMALAMQVCTKAGKQFIVLDRPNPLDGTTLEGPVLDLNFASFVGLYAIPVRHGMTIGEIAQWVNGTYDIGADLTVIAMGGWKRTMDFSQSGLPWVAPSPNMPTLDTARVYPGGCLIEGTLLSEGRGTTRPFELIGAPYIESERVADALNAKKLPGVFFRACRFEPTFHKFEKQLCGGIQIHITGKQFDPFVAYLVLIQTIQQLYPNDFGWRPPPYEYETEKLPFDILCGTDQVRMALERGESMTALAKRWKAELNEFRKQRRPFLLYN